MKSKKDAIKFFAKYFKITEDEAKDCNYMTIDCMVKFANSSVQNKNELNIPDVSNSVCKCGKNAKITHVGYSCECGNYWDELAN